MKLSLPANSRRRRGFTLIELLAAMTILAILVAGLFATFSQASRGWLQSENRVETFSQARAVLDFMARELTQTMTTSNISFLGSATNVAFVALISSDTNVDLVEVVYQQTRSNVTNTLTRGVWTYPVYSIAPQNFYSSSYYNTWPAAVTVSNITLADNVMSLTLSYTDTSGTSQSNWNSTASSGWSGISPGTPTMANRAPAGVQITIGILDSRAAARLATVGGASTITGQAITNQATQYFSTYVAIPNGQ